MFRFRPGAIFSSRVHTTSLLVKIFTTIMALLVSSPVLFALVFMTRTAVAASLPILFDPSVLIDVSTAMIYESAKRALTISGASSRQVITLAVTECTFFLILSACYALRIKTLRLFQPSGLNSSRCLLHGIYLSSLCFLISVLSAGLGWGLNGKDVCKAAIELCLVFYMGGKVLLYIFLTDRVHALRRAYYTRSQDYLWQSCFFLVIAVFGEITLICFFYPISSEDGGYCMIGLRTYITLPMLIFDIFCNTGVSIIFYIFARDQFGSIFEIFIDPEISCIFKRISTIFYCGGDMVGINLSARPVPKASQTLVTCITRKSLSTSVAILFSTVANLTLLFHYNGAEHGWLCWLMCSMDITWNTLWVTFVTSLPAHGEIIISADYTDHRRDFENKDSNSNDIHLQDFPPRAQTAETAETQLSQSNSFSALQSIH